MMTATQIWDHRSCGIHFQVKETQQDICNKFQTISTLVANLKGFIYKLFLVVPVIASAELIFGRVYILIVYILREYLSTNKPTW